jgi:FMN phosphatase YigB (HAD superfamily)
MTDTVKLKKPIRHIMFDLHGVLFAYADPGSEKSYRVLEPGYALLQDLAQALGDGSKIVACTNWSPERIEQLQYEHPQVMGLFHDVITPSRAGARKPDPRIFAYVMASHDILPHETLFIDDQLDNVLAARAFGLIGFHADDFERMRSEITQSVVEI